MRMAEPSAELSTDLEWMLASGQATAEMLVETLAGEYFSPVYRMALAILGQPALAYQATCATFSNALLNVYCYQPGEKVQLWLFRIALDTFRTTRRRRAHSPDYPVPVSPARNAPLAAPDPLDLTVWRVLDDLLERTRLPVLLRFLFGWPVDEIASTLRVPPNSIHWQLVIAQKRFLAAAWKNNPQHAVQSEREMENRLETSLQARWPAVQFPVQDLQAAAAQILEVAGRERVRQKKLLSVKEGVWMAVSIFAVGMVLWMANRLLPEPAGESSPPPVSTRVEIVYVTPAAKVVVATIQPEATQSQSRLRRGGSRVYVVQPGDTLDSIANFLGVSAGELRLLNQLNAGETITPGQVLLIWSGFTPEAALSPTPVTPAPQPEPLTLTSSSEAIRTRLVHSSEFWNTLWVDATLVDYGPENYVGPPDGTHIQAWISLPRTSLMLEGPFGRQPDRGLAVWGSRAYDFDLAAGGIAEGVMSVLVDIPELKSMLFPRVSQWADPSGTFQALNLTEVDGRKALAVDWISSHGSRGASLRIDVATGVVLGATWFNSREEVRAVVEVNQVFFDVDFPEKRLYYLENLWAREFAADYTGKPADQAQVVRENSVPFSGWRERLDTRPPNELFDPAQYDLVFQYPEEFFTRADQAPVALFAGGSFLGQVPMGNPWTMICDRSDNGENLAFVNRPGSQWAGDSFLQTFALDDLVVYQEPVEDVTFLAYAPDNRRLAVVGSPIASGQRGVFVVDTQTHIADLLLWTLDAKSLVWDPDGRYLAMIANLTGAGQDEVLVVYASDGTIVYRDPVDTNSGRDSAPWPMLEWGVSFPVEMGGIESCGRRPAG